MPYTHDFLPRSSLAPQGRRQSRELGVLVLHSFLLHSLALAQLIWSYGTSLWFA